jgi:hypothetical protein
MMLIGLADAFRTRVGAIILPTQLGSFSESGNSP